MGVIGEPGRMIIDYPCEHPSATRKETAAALAYSGETINEYLAK